MDLSAADVILLNRVRERQRFAGFSRALYLAQTLVFAALAAHSAVLWASMPPLPGTDAWSVALQLQRQTACLPGVVGGGLFALFNAAMWFLSGDQRRADALILKLADQRSGYPDYTR
ncbi:MAG TPA: hypothetical protein VF950_00125 [Planctomycetota bacterium]